RHVDRNTVDAIDHVIGFLGTVPPIDSQPTGRVRRDDPRLSDPPATQPRGTVTAWGHLAIASMMVIRVNLSDKRVAALAGYSPGVREAQPRPRPARMPPSGPGEVRPPIVALRSAKVL